MKKIILLLTVLIPVSGAAESFMHCDSLLQHGITNITKHQSAKHTIAYKWHSNCGMNFDTATDTAIRKASVSIFDFGGSASTNSSHQKTKVQEWCNENESFAKDNRNLYEEARVISDPALQAWNQCQEIAKKGVFISANVHGDHSDFVHFEIDSTLDADLRLFPHTTTNYQCTTLLSSKSGEDKGRLMGYDPNEQPLIRNSNIHVNCIRKNANVKNSNGIITSKYEQAYVSIQTSGPSLQFYAPEIVDDYITTPKGAVVPFSKNSCPNGWSEYTPAYGRFIRGSDNSGQNIDPKTERKVGDLQEDSIKTHNHPVTDPGHLHNMGGFTPSGNIYDNGGSRSAWSYYSAPNKQVSRSATGIGIKPFGVSETRPKNVSLLYCIKN